MGRFASLPIVAVTGKSPAGERERCLEAGASDYIPKPVDASQLFDALTPWVPTPIQPVA
jgi:CheY-like chemotaxis protein